MPHYKKIKIHVTYLGRKDKYDYFNAVLCKGNDRYDCSLKLNAVAESVRSITKDTEDEKRYIIYFEDIKSVLMRKYIFNITSEMRDIVFSSEVYRLYTSQTYDRPDTNLSDLLIQGQKLCREIHIFMNDCNFLYTKSTSNLDSIGVYKDQYESLARRLRNHKKLTILEIEQFDLIHQYAKIHNQNMDIDSISWLLYILKEIHLSEVNRYLKSIKGAYNRIMHFWPWSELLLGNIDLDIDSIDTIGDKIFSSKLDKNDKSRNKPSTYIECVRITTDYKLILSERMMWKFERENPRDWKKFWGGYNPDTKVIDTEEFMINENGDRLLWFQSEGWVKEQIKLINSWGELHI